MALRLPEGNRASRAIEVATDYFGRLGFALMDGLQVQWLLAPERVDMPSLVRQRIESALVVPLPMR